MAVVYALLSMSGYALQTALLAPKARTLDGLSLAFVRNATLSMILLPLLFLDLPGAAVALRHGHLLALSGVAGGLALALRYTSLRSLPVGVSQSVSTVVSSGLLILFGWRLLDEPLGADTLLLLAVILLGSFWCGLQRNPLPHLDNRHLRGVCFAVLAAFPHALTVFLFALVAREAGVLAVSYLWECAIAVGALGVLLARRTVTGNAPPPVPLREWISIGLRGSPTLIGTTGYALAIREGGVAVTSAIGSAAIVLISLLAWWMYGERLRPGQWIALGIVTAGIAGLRLVS